MYTSYSLVFHFPQYLGRRAPWDHGDRPSYYNTHTLDRKLVRSRSGSSTYIWGIEATRVSNGAAEYTEKFPFLELWGQRFIPGSSEMLRSPVSHQPALPQAPTTSKMAPVPSKCQAPHETLRWVQYVALQGFQSTFTALLQCLVCAEGDYRRGRVVM